MLLQADKELRSLKFKASRVMCGDEVHIQIGRGDRMRVDVIEDTT